MTMTRSQRRSPKVMQCCRKANYLLTQNQTRLKTLPKIRPITHLVVVLTAIVELLIPSTTKGPQPVVILPSNNNTHPKVKAILHKVRVTHRRAKATRNMATHNMDTHNSNPTARDHLL
jgi:hypothetical protein